MWDSRRKGSESDAKEEEDVHVHDEGSQLSYENPEVVKHEAVVLILRIDPTPENVRLWTRRSLSVLTKRQMV